MYGMAILLSLATTAGTVGMPFFQLGSVGPIQAFGIIVAAGVLIGAALLRRYAEWHGVSDDHIRGLLGWVTVTGFIGAHVFDVIAYQWDDFMRDPLLMLKIWSGISSYGGFIGGAIGFAWYVWWKKLPVRLLADVTIVGLLPAFSIGRIGCTVVSDHIGAVVENKDAWYAQLAMEYPTNLNMDAIQYLLAQHPEAASGKTILAWNLGFIELLYLIPVNALILWLAFRASKRVPAGFVTALTGVLYAPVRFFMDYLRPPNSDPRHFELTFAQWSSILAFGVAVYAAARILKKGSAAETVARTSGEAQQRLRKLLADEEAEAKKPKDKNAEKSGLPKATAKAKDKDKAKADKPADKPAEKSHDEKTPEERKADLIAAIKREKPAAAKDSEKAKPAERADDAKPAGSDEATEKASGAASKDEASKKD